jgi:hypothetical protein
MCATYSEKSRKSHFDSFANKILTGIKEIVPEYAERRAIWELFQNALDIIDGENGELSVEVTPTGFMFTHNARPFKDDNLGALVKQYSNGKDYGSNKNQTGQYGTGFLSTHVYGRKIILNGSVQVDDGSYRLLKDFELDRTANDVSLLSISLMQQDDKVVDICDGENYRIEQALCRTSFEYFASVANKESIAAMVEYLHSILPFVFCFNDRLSIVIIKDAKDVVTYKRIESPKNELKLLKNNTPIDFKYLENKDPNIRIVFPQKELDFSLIPKLFLFYPLAETISNGLNFLIHAQEFRPNRERDFLHLKASNEDLISEVAANKELLEKSYNIIIDKIKSDEQLDFLSAANIQFMGHDDDFEVLLKEKYTSEIRQLKRIPVKDVLKDISEISFFDEELLDYEPEILKSFYNVCSQFIELPEFDSYIFLSKIVCNWRKAGVADLQIFGRNEIFTLVSEKTQADYNIIKDKGSYITMIRCVNSNIDLLNEVSLIPNIHNELKTFNELVRWNEREFFLIKVTDAINASLSASYLHDDYYFITNLKTYSRIDFKEDFSKFCNEINDTLSKNYAAFARL